MFYFIKSGPLYEWGAGINVLVAESTGVASIERGFGCPIPDSAGSSLLKQVCPEGLHPMEREDMLE